MATTATDQDPGFPVGIENLPLSVARRNRVLKLSQRSLCQDDPGLMNLALAPTTQIEARSFCEHKRRNLPPLKVLS